MAVTVGKEQPTAADDGDGRGHLEEELCRGVRWHKDEVDTDGKTCGGECSGGCGGGCGGVAQTT